MAYLFAPSITRLVPDADGVMVPAVGYKSYFFAAGTDTPVTTWADAGEATPNPNPVVHDANGSALVYFTGSVLWAFTDPDDVMVPGWPIDNIDAPVVTPPTISAWEASGVTVTRIDDVTFRVDGDYTGLFQPSRRVLVCAVGATVVGSILASYIDSGYTWVIVKSDDAQALPVSILSVDVGILEADPYAGPAPSGNHDLAINPHFYGWPEGTAFSVTGNSPGHYGADLWKFLSSTGTGEGGAATFQTNRIEISTDEAVASGSRYAARIRAHSRTGSIFEAAGDGCISYVQGQRLYDAVPWLGKRCVLEMWLLSLGVTFSVNSWVGVWTDQWNVFRGDSWVLDRAPRRFVSAFVLPSLNELVGVTSDASRVVFGIDLYRGSTNPETDVLLPKAFAEFDLMVLAGHFTLDEVFGRRLAYVDALDKRRRETYFFSSYPDGVAPGTANTDSPFMLTSANTTDAYGNIRWPSQMADIPQVGFYAPQAGTALRLERVSTGAVAGAAISSARFDASGVSLIVSGGGALVAGEAYRVHVTADARW